MPRPDFIVDHAGPLPPGRSLAALGRPDEPLLEARELFASIGYEPAPAETEAVLAQDAAA